MNAQGEDVVAGIRTPVHIPNSRRSCRCLQQLREITTRLEKHYRDLQDSVHHPGWPVVHAANAQRQADWTRRSSRRHPDGGRRADHEGEAIFRVEPNQLYDFLVPSLNEKGKDIEVLSTGLPASPGAAVGQIVFTAEDAVEKFSKDKGAKLILVRAKPRRKTSRAWKLLPAFSLRVEHDQPRRRRNPRMASAARRSRRYRSR